MSTESITPAYSYATGRQLSDRQIGLIAAAAGIVYAVAALYIICYA